MRRAASAALLLLGAYSAATAEIPAPVGCTDLAPAAQLAAAVAACTAEIDGKMLQDEASAEAYRRRGWALGRSERFVEAHADLDRALAIKPDWPQALADKGRVFMRERRYGEARASFVAALQIDPDYAPAHSGLGWYLMDNNDLEGAYQAYARAYELDPKDWHALANRGNSSLYLGRPTNALEDLDKALEADPKELDRIHTNWSDTLGIGFHTQLQVMRATTLHHLGNLEEPIAIYTAILREHPGYTQGAIRLSDLLWTGRRDWHAAIEVLSRAAEHDPKDWWIKMQMARIHALRNDGNAARAVLAELQPPTKDDGPAPFFQSRSRVLRVLGDYDGAVADVLSGVRVDNRYLASIAIDMRKRGYLMDLAHVPMQQQFLNGLQACVRDFECAYWE